MKEPPGREQGILLGKASAFSLPREINTSHNCQVKKLSHPLPLLQPGTGKKPQLALKEWEKTHIWKIGKNKPCSHPRTSLLVRADQSQGEGRSFSIIWHTKFCQINRTGHLNYRHHTLSIGNVFEKSDIQHQNVNHVLHICVCVFVDT